MTQENQVEGIKHILLRMSVCERYAEIKCVEDCEECTATQIYNAGYRKQSEGEWVKRLDEYDCEYAQCSRCKEEFYDANGEDTIDRFYNFCPNCGARMKGGAEA